MNYKSKTKNNNRNRSHGYWMYGKHAVLAAILNNTRVIDEIVVTRSNESDAHTALKTANRTCSLSTKERPAIDALFSQAVVHQGIAAYVQPLSSTPLSATSNMSQILILDHVTDPQNVGAIWRTAAAFGAQAIITTKDGAPQENAAWAKNASGTLEILPQINVANLASTLKSLKNDGYWIIGLDGYSDISIKKVPDYDKIVIIMGAEGAGLRELTKKHCDMLIHLPISSQVESLNVSNAAAIALYELFTL